MKLSYALKKGSKGKKHGTGYYIYKGGVCALGAIARGIKPGCRWHEVCDIITWSGMPNDVRSDIFRMNDNEKKSFWAIRKYLISKGL